MTLEELKEKGFTKGSCDLPLSWRNLIDQKDWETLYKDCLGALKDGQWLANLVKEHSKSLFETEEFEWEIMLALREGPQDPEDEGIWHDDGSRDFALSISLNPSPTSYQGGSVLVRPKDNIQEIKELGPLPWGHYWLFATGRYGWDHRTTIVTHGNRLVLVLWITLKDRK